MFSDRKPVPRNGHILIVGIVARISGCADQKEVSLDDQVDHGKQVVVDMYEGPATYRPVATIGKGEALDRPELEQIEAELRKGELEAG
jgi:site-specific DNA recombinase